MNKNLELCVDSIYDYYLMNNYNFKKEDIKAFLLEMSKLFNFHFDSWIIKFISLKHPLKIEIETIQRSTIYIDDGEEDYTIINDMFLYKEEKFIPRFQSFLFGNYEISYCLYAKAKIIFISLPEKIK